MGEDIYECSGPIFSPDWFREQYPEKLLFRNVSCEVTLPLGNVYDVEYETLEIIERIGEHRGICIASSSEVHEKVPPENAAKMYQSVHAYGTYPIDVTVSGNGGKRFEIRSPREKKRWKSSRRILRK